MTEDMCPCHVLLTVVVFAMVAVITSHTTARVVRLHPVTRPSVTTSVYTALVCKHPVGQISKHIVSDGSRIPLLVNRIIYNYYY